MKLKPLKKYSSPCYPEKSIVNENPELLRIIPRRWEGKQYLGMVMSALLVLTLSACEGKKEPEFQQLEGKIVAKMGITEEQAFNIIQEEAKKAGINFKKNSFKLDGIKMPVHDNKNNIDIESENEQTIKLDGYDSSKKIGFEYVTKDDIYEWGKGIKTSDSSESAYLSDTNTSDFLNKSIKGKDYGISVRFFQERLSGEEEGLKRQVQEYISWLHSQGII